MKTYQGKGWFEYLDKVMQELVEEAYYLLDREEMANEDLVDYAFVVFPMAKAYEGFVKKYLFDVGLISEKTYLGRHFRIGRSLNPSLPVKYRNGWWIYDDLERMCGQMGEEMHRHKALPRMMWSAWREGRNKTFHYFMGREKLVTLVEARKLIDDFREVMEVATECRLEMKGQKN